MTQMCCYCQVEQHRFPRGTSSRKLTDEGTRGAHTRVAFFLFWTERKTRQCVRLCIPRVLCTGQNEQFWRNLSSCKIAHPFGRCQSLFTDFPKFFMCSPTIHAVTGARYRLADNTLLPLFTPTQSARTTTQWHNLRYRGNGMAYATYPDFHTP